MINNGKINIVIVGGCGFWTEKNHAKNILKFKSINRIDCRVVAIIDPTRPEERARHKNLAELCSLDKPIHII